ncbi:MAG: hypothetical protein ACK4E5_10205 [Erythrobacter cryptus]
MSRESLAAVQLRRAAACALAEACRALLAASGGKGWRRGSALPDAAPLHGGMKARRPRELHGGTGSLPS